MNKTIEQIPIVIPAYEPDERLLLLINQLIDCSIGPIIILNDGSGETYTRIFEQAGRLLEGTEGVVLSHDVNKGKGRALKTAFEYIINSLPNAVGCITADSDGQHTAICIRKVAEALMLEPNSFILGVRDFYGDGIPWKSRFGNFLTEKIFQYITGVHVSDTQTGLRGIPMSFMKHLLNVKGERFEFETQMLLESVGHWPIVEVSIETIYDSKENHQTHFNPIIDSIKIYRILGKKFCKYILSSFSSGIIDVTLFAFMCNVLKIYSESYIVMATIFARILSATFNYFMNLRVVFRSRRKCSKSALKYLILAITQMILSAFLVDGMVAIMPFASEVILKIIVDATLFFISYYVQQIYVF